MHKCSVMCQHKKSTHTHSVVCEEFAAVQCMQHMRSTPVATFVCPCTHPNCERVRVPDCARGWRNCTKAAQFAPFVCGHFPTCVRTRARHTSSQTKQQAKPSATITQWAKRGVALWRKDTSILCCFARRCNSQDQLSKTK